VPAGPVEISGTFTVTNDYVIATYIVEHAVALVDMYGFVIRDEEWELPVDSQVLGFLSVDVENLSGEYAIDLPARPEGTLADVDNDGQSEEGVQIFAVAYSPNIAGGPFSEGDDRSLGWPSYLASVKTDSENEDEVIGGKLVVWAPDDRQEFPTGFGADGLLFTEDDPVGPIPAGYSIIDLDQSPFGVSQEAEPELTLYEPKDIAVKDFSDLGYTEAFEELYKAISRDWAFNGVKGKEVDWEALHDEIAPRVAEAEKNKDALEFYRALHDFTLAIPDGHVGLGGGELGNADFQPRVAGGYGFAIRELVSGEFAVVFVTRGGPAEEAGMELGAEVTEFDGRPIAEAVSQIQPYAGPFSQEIFKRYQQARYLLRAPVGTEASVTFVSPGGQPQTATLTAIEERDSFQFTSIYYGFEPSDLPVTFRLLDTGVGYINVASYYDDLNLIIRLFERALKTFQAQGVSSIVIDLRFNGGGNPLGLAGFLYDQEIPLGQKERYSEKTGKFEPVGVPDKVLPNTNQYEFEKIAVLVGPACFSACEQEAYSFSQVPGAIVVGYYSSGGVFADVARGQVSLPEGMSLQFSTDRFVNPDGSLFLEGKGAVPTVRVPLTLENLLSTEDVVLRAAEDALLGVGAGDLKIEGGPVLASAAASRKALGAGAQFLEDLAAERYDSQELSQAGQTYVYTVNLERDQRLFLINGWCATTQEILRDNYTHITLEYSVNGVAVPLDHFAVFDGPAGDQFCKYYYSLVYRWPKGATTIEVKVTFDAAINDGIADYPEGTHIYQYVVTRP
jgi:C-terminal processing protease CtpA/Prc